MCVVFTRLAPEFLELQLHLIVFLFVPYCVCPSILAPCYLAAMLRPSLHGTSNPMVDRTLFGRAIEFSHQYLPGIALISALKVPYPEKCFRAGETRMVSHPSPAGQGSSDSLSCILDLFLDWFLRFGQTDLNKTQ